MKLNLRRHIPASFPIVEEEASGPSLPTFFGINNLTESDHRGAQWPLRLIFAGMPFEGQATGVVSLLEMLDFSAREYAEITYYLGLVIAKLSPNDVSFPDVGRKMSVLLGDANRMGLIVTRDALWRWVDEMSGINPGKFKFERQGKEVLFSGQNLEMHPDRLKHHMECVYATLQSELNAIRFKAIPKDKMLYADPKWLTDSAVFKNFPTGWKEMQSGGRCFSYGENTACAFHLNRALEWGLKSLAVKLGRRFDRNSWNQHLEDIDKELTAKYKNTTQRSAEQEFYSNAASQFGNMKVAWRNPTMHVEAHYDEREGAYLLSTVEAFMLHLSNNGLTEPVTP